jgi:hypothetical protein
VTRRLGPGPAAETRALDVIVFPGSSRPHVRVADYLALVQTSTYDEGGVRLTGR